MQTAKAWPIDPFGLRNVQLEVSAKSYHRDNWLMAAKRPERRCFLLLETIDAGSRHPRHCGRTARANFEAAKWPRKARTAREDGTVRLLWLSALLRARKRPRIWPRLHMQMLKYDLMYAYAYIYVYVYVYV